MIHNIVDRVQYESISNQLPEVGHTDNASVTHTPPQSDAHLKNAVTTM